VKVFAIYLRFALTSQPEWFDELRKKYSSTSILHITLIQPRYVSENTIQDLKNKVAEVLNSNTFKAEDKKLFFDKTELEWDEGDDQYLVMSFIKKNKSVLKLQKNLMAALREFDEYCNEITKEYELNFRPHLTVADKIDSGSKEGVSARIPEMDSLEGNITDLVLAVVSEQTIAESENPNNYLKKF
jgi:2'-5' RNA ligase